MPSPGRTPPDLEYLKANFFAGLSRYEFLEPIGRGGMALVLKVRDLELDEVIAMKVLWGSSWTEPEMLLSRFKSEISLNRRIKHPNVCRLHDFGVHAEFPYLTMEWVPGRDFGRVLENDGPLDVARVVQILGKTARGCAAAHDVGVIHRDLKPANLMIRPDDEVSILDFGLARDATKTSARITEVGTTVGTPHYMSPEQVHGGIVDGRSDIYAIGALAYEALAGCHLFTGLTPMSIALKHVEALVPIEPLKDRHVSRELIAIVLRCLRKEPETRFQSAGELAQQLETLSRLLAPEAEAPGVRQRNVQTKTHDRSRLLGAIGKEEKPLVLIVDDEPAIRRLLARVVTDAGFSAAEAASGEESLQFLQTRLADLILMDVLMPGIDGFDTVRILKSQSRYAAIPILFMSQLPERNRVAFASQTGAVAFMPKPLDLEALVGEIRRILSSLTA